MTATQLIILTQNFRSWTEELVLEITIETTATEWVQISNSGQLAQSIRMDDKATTAKRDSRQKADNEEKTQRVPMKSDFRSEEKDRRVSQGFIFAPELIRSNARAAASKKAKDENWARLREFDFGLERKDGEGK